MKRTQFFICTLLALVSYSSNAETKSNLSVTNNPTGIPTAEQRQKMADLHEKMATCLRSDRAFPECRQEMMKNCGTTMGKAGCPMMGSGMGPGMGPGQGRGRRFMMDQKTTTKE